MVLGLQKKYINYYLNGQFFDFDLIDDICAVLRKEYEWMGSDDIALHSLLREDQYMHLCRLAGFPSLMGHRTNFGYVEFDIGIFEDKDIIAVFMGEDVPTVVVRK